MPTTILDSLDLTSGTRTLLREQQIHDDDRMRRLFPEDVAQVIARDRILLRDAFPNLNPALSTLAAARPGAREAVLTRLARGERSADLLEAARAAGVLEVVVDREDCPDIAATRSYLAHLDDGNGRPVSGLWHDQPIVETVEVIRGQTVRRNPITGATLQDGVDELTRAAWGRLSVLRAALVRWSSTQGLLQGLPEQTILLAFTNTDDLAKRCEARRAALRHELGEEVRFVAGLSTPRPPAAPSHNTTKIDASSPSGALHQLIVTIFGSAEEVSRFIRSNVDGSLAQGLPGNNVSLATMAFEAANRLRSHGYMDAFLGALRSEFPRRRADIDYVARLLGAM